MTINIQLNIPLSSLDSLYKLAESQSKKVSISPEILKLLLLDYSIMIRAISDNSSFKVKEPRHRETLK